MQEWIEVVKLLLKSNVVPSTALIIILPTLIDALTGAIISLVLLYVLIRYRRGIKDFILKLFRGYE